ncbi:PD-(D/E)XK nuclease family protein [Lewinella sp. 4G2]|uniref:PD-(D/E)XK nuclease family protein n=1 Tax=Lewinella sp. 4G2 TaxID=1803372 RepID=UPI0012F77945|nr:PD-(D/E)XK nuclease family protein [Lewinella sp. 4G2]
MPRITILLGLTLGEPRLLSGRANIPTYSPAILLRYLESFYALGAPSINRSALRIEQYRQVIAVHEAQTKREPFYAKTFRADQLATAEELLSRRDELLDGGFDLLTEATEAVPERIRTTLELERILLDDSNDLDLLPGQADRLRSLIAALPEDRHPRLHVLLNEPRELLPPGTQRLLTGLEAVGDTIAQLPEPAAPATNSDLHRWQRHLRGGAPTEADTSLRGDGSLIILRAQRETHLAAYLARTLRENPSWRPSALLTVRNQTLDNAITMEGLPSMGVPSSSLARPTLQVLKLVTAFLWEPIEVERIMEFVSLVSKPLHYRLAQKIAVFLADTPGMFGPRWRAMIEGFFRAEQARGKYSTKKLKQIRDQYEMWFERRRYRREETVPKLQLRFLFLQLREWAREERQERRDADTRDGRPADDYAGLLVLYAQAQRAVELLDAQPETGLNYLSVERLVRTIYEPAPAQFRPEEQGALPAIFAPASAATLPTEPGVESVLWWDFIENEPDYFFSRYYPPEVAYLAELNVAINGPDTKNALSNWQQMRPVLNAGKQLVLCLPDRVDGAEVEPHPLLGDLEAAFPEGSLERITIDIDKTTSAKQIPGLDCPVFADVPLHPLEGPVPHLHVERLRDLPERDKESPTSVEDFMFYPHKYVFRHALKLKGTPILRIASEGRLRGNLAHRLIEQLLKEIGSDRNRMTRSEVDGWIDANADRLFRNQGAVLLQYGQEPERIQFIRTMKKSAWSLVYAIRENGWLVRGSEEYVHGDLEAMGQQLHGRADLVLSREANGIHEVAVVDLKWQGKGLFQNLLRNARDVQLALYGDFIAQNKMADEDGALLHRQPGRVHTAYFLIRFGKILARNQVAFRQAETVGDEEANSVQLETLRKIRNTYNWRWELIRNGDLEIRCAETAGHLDDLYRELAWEDLFEQENDTSRFDDYQSLIGLVR